MSNPILEGWARHQAAQFLRHEPDIAGEHAVQGTLRELGRGADSAVGMAEELQHRPVEVLHPSVPDQPHPADGKPLVPAGRERAAFWDLPAVEVPGQGRHRGRLAQSRKGVHRDTLR
ncbi:hypothetical protein AB0M41_41235 [Streptomyces sp. NPDC051896]|uniref:hypothetical protein n=1 Tax=Streptomyces sp. NPDC051896 TaxID=3155416 RepID=UPI00344A5569